MTAGAVATAEFSKRAFSSRQQLENETRTRADIYRVLAALLGTSPEQNLIDFVVNFSPFSPSAFTNIRRSSDVVNGSTPSTECRFDTDALFASWNALNTEAKNIDLQSMDDEYHDLFIGIGRGELVPYGSWYLTGFLMDKPLSDLRDDLKQLGIERDRSVRDPEDHIGALFDAMALIIDAPDIDERTEQNFFNHHIATWAEKFFTDLQQARFAHFYKSVGAVGENFMLFEKHYFSMSM